MKKHRFLNRFFYPDLYVGSLFDLDLQVLREKGIKGLLFDLDNTIVRRDGDSLPLQEKKWLESLISSGFCLAIVSNNKEKRVAKLAGELSLPYVCRAVKPFARSFRQAMQIIGTEGKNTAVVGDQLFTDILGGKMLGLFTILVAPMPGREFIGTRLISRPFEKIILSCLALMPDRNKR